MAKAAHSEDLKKAFLAHHDETEGQIERLQQVFEIFGKRAQAKTCEAIRGILEEGEEIIENYIEHYEISRYGTLKTWRIRLGLKDAATLLDQNLQEEKKTDVLLSKLAEASINAEAA